MNAWRKISTIAAFEFLAAVKRPGYLIATFGMPVFMALYAAVIAVPAYFAEKKDSETSVYGIVDRAGLLELSGDVAAPDGNRIPDSVRRTLEAAGQRQALEQAMAHGKFVFTPFASEEEARHALAARTLGGYFVVPEEYLATGHVVAYSPDSFSFSGSDAQRALGELIRQRLVAGRLDADVTQRVLQPIADTDAFAVTRTGEIRDGGEAAAVVRLMAPLVFMVLFILSVLMTSGFLMQGTATEKENKVVEVLLASADPDQILTGKLLGLGAAGLLQIAVWLAIALVAGLGVVPLLVAARVEVPWVALALAVPFFIVAFLFFGTLMLGTGSLGSNMREAQQLAMVWSLTAALPLMMLAALMRDPNGIIARVMTWLPFTSGPVIVLRASTDAASLAWWEVAGAFGVLVLSTVVAIRIGARLFRIGLLSSSRPRLREILRQARLAG